MWRRRQKRVPTSRLQKRIEALPSGEIIGWAEQSLFEIGRNLRGGEMQIAAAEQAAEALHLATRELKRRQDI